MKVFTSGQVATICKVAPRTVEKWFDSGRLKGYRISSSPERLIPKGYLIKFLKEHGMPLGGLEDESTVKVLIVSQDQDLIQNLKTALTTENSFRVTVANSGFEAEILSESFHPDAMIIDFSMGQVEALQICQNLRSNPDFSELTIVTLLSRDDTTSFDSSLINEAFKEPIDGDILSEQLRTLIGSRKEPI